MGFDDHDHDDDDDDFEFIGPEGSDADDDSFRAFMDADERAFTGECGTMVNDLVRDAIPTFADLTDEVFAKGWTETADTLAAELSRKLMHVNEHIATGWTPIAWFGVNELHTTKVTPAPGRWLIPAITTWMNVASSEGAGGLLRSRLPWMLPMVAEIYGDMSRTASLSLDLGIARLADLSVALMERGLLSEEDTMAMLESIESREDAQGMAGSFAEIWFDVAPGETPLEEAEMFAPHFAVSEDGTFELSDGANDIARAMMNEQDFSYDWGSGLTAVWLMLISTQILFREKNTISEELATENTDEDSPTVGDTEVDDPGLLLIPIGEDNFWIWPDIDDDLAMFIDPLAVVRVITKDDEPDATEIADLTDHIAINEGRVLLTSLTDLTRHDADNPAPYVEMHAEDLSTGLADVLRGVTVPFSTVFGNSLRVTFHHKSDDQIYVPWKMKVTDDADLDGVTASQAFLGQIQPGTGVAYSKMMDAMLGGLGYLTSARIDQKTMENSDELWAYAVLSLTRTIASAAVTALSLMAGEHAPAAVRVEFDTTITGDLLGVRFLSPDGSVVVMSGSDLARRDVIHSDLETLSQALSLASEMTGHAASALFDSDKDADEFAADWLPTLHSDGTLTLDLIPDAGWGARVGTAQVH